MLKPWSLKHAQCINCGTIALPHRGRGLCKVCYEREANKRTKLNKPSFNRKHDILRNVTREYFIELYERNGASLQDIANELKCSRQYVLKLMKSFGIERRSRQSARTVAINKGKIVYEIEDVWGNLLRIQHQEVNLNRAFFQNWSDGFAYVLGLIYTDGNLLKNYFSKSQNRVVNRHRVSIYQKDPFILNRIKELLALNTRIIKKRNNKNSYVHTLSFDDKEIYEKLESFGLCPNKSLKIKFPSVPMQYLGGFIRGLFDGDGSYSNGRARLTTGSIDFANGLISILESVGFRVQLHETPTSHLRKNKSYTVEVSSSKPELIKFYNFLYTGATIFIPRKHDGLRDNLSLSPSDGIPIDKPTQN